MQISVQRAMEEDRKREEKIFRVIRRKTNHQESDN